MIGKLHSSLDSKIFAACDKELIDLRLNFNNTILHLSKSFYGEKEISKDELINKINECDSINIFGKKICSFLLSKKIISEDQIIYIDNIPHIQIYKV